MKYLFLTAACLMGLLSLPACHKHHAEPKQYSTWIVNGQDTFRTNNVDSSIDCNPDHSYCRAILQSKDLSNYFVLSFALDYFPVEGKFELDTNNIIAPHILLFNVTFYYNNLFYYHMPSEIDTVYASSVNGKVCYTMPSCWFVNYYDPNDSILVEGTFNIP